jgi:hypothetical protein
MHLTQLYSLIFTLSSNKLERLTLTKICRPSLIFVPGMKTERVEHHTVHHREDRLLALRERAGLSRRPFPLANALAYHLKMCKLGRIKFRGSGLRNVQSLTLCSNSQNMHGLFGVFQSINFWPTDFWSTNERTFISVGLKPSLCT